MSETPEHLLDRIAIVDLTIAYCWAIDERAWSRLDDVYMPDATATLGTTPYNGIAEIVGRCVEVLEPLDASQHMITNQQIQIDGDAATCRSYFSAQHIKESAPGGPHYVVAGIYDDKLVRSAAGWRIAHRTLITLWTEGNPGVIGAD